MVIHFVHVFWYILGSLLVLVHTKKTPRFVLKNPPFVLKNPPL